MPSFRTWFEGQKSWTLKDANIYVQTVRPLFGRAGFDLKIVGSVATKGFSDNDLDILAVQTRYRKISDFNILDSILGEPQHYDGPNAEESGHSVNRVVLSDGRIVDFFLTDPHNYGSD